MDLERFWIKMCSSVFLNVRPANKHTETHGDYNSKLGSKGKALLDLLENITLWHIWKPDAGWQTSRIMAKQ